MSEKTVTLKPGKTCKIGDDVIITAVESRKGRVSFRVKAPREKAIVFEQAAEKPSDSTCQSGGE